MTERTAFRLRTRGCFSFLSRRVPASESSHRHVVEPPIRPGCRPRPAGPRLTALKQSWGLTALVLVLFHLISVPPAGAQQQPDTSGSDASGAPSYGVSIPDHGAPDLAVNYVAFVHQPVFDFSDAPRAKEALCERRLAYRDFIVGAFQAAPLCAREDTTRYSPTRITMQRLGQTTKVVKRFWLCRPYRETSVYVVEWSVCSENHGRGGGPFLCVEVKCSLGLDIKETGQYIRPDEAIQAQYCDAVTTALQKANEAARDFLLDGGFDVDDTGFGSCWIVRER